MDPTAKLAEAEAAPSQEPLRKLAEVIRNLTAAMEGTSRGGRGRWVDTEDLREALLTIADEIDPL